GAIGDGIADDSGAIQDAIDDTLPTGTVFFPSGTYLIGTRHGQFGVFGANACGIDPGAQVQSGLFIGKPNITIRGAGRGTILRLPGTAKMRILTWVQPGLLLEKLVLDGNGALRVRFDPNGRPYSWPCGLVVDGLVAGFTTVGGSTVQDVEARNGIED